MVSGAARVVTAILAVASMAATLDAQWPAVSRGVVAPRYMIDITIDLEPDKVPFTPWAAALYQQRISAARIQQLHR